jgi:SAM-dependent methyltransferase
MRGFPVEIANVEQAAAWNGHEGEVWTEHADRFDRASWRHWQRFLDAVLITGDDDVLDVGCGTGKATRDVARLASEGSALGIDLSATMLQRAREQSQVAGLTNVTFVQGDAQVHPFDVDAFDLAMSSFGAMFFNDPVAAFTNIGRGLRSGGTLALLAWRELGRNEWLVELRRALAMGRQLPEPPPDAPTPFALADPDRVRGLLGRAGYTDIAFEPIDEPVEFGRDVDDAFAFTRVMGIVEGLSHDLDDDARAKAMDNIRTLLAAHETSEGVLLGTSAWLITATRA